MVRFLKGDWLNLVRFQNEYEMRNEDLVRFQNEEMRNEDFSRFQNEYSVKLKKEMNFLVPEWG